MKNKKLQIILGSLLSFLIVITVFLATRASAEGVKLTVLENESTVLLEKNQELNDKIISSTSLSEVSKVASGSGMIKPENFLYITGNGIAMR